MKISRTKFDGKMSKILSGAGGASCQLCTATHLQLKDLELIRSCFPINRQIQDAISIFNDVEISEFLKLDSNSRFGLTHPPTSDKLLAHSPELIATYNSGYGLKKISEEGLEALNKYVRKYRKSLARKLSFESNIKDVLVRLTTQSV